MFKTESIGYAVYADNDSDIKYAKTTDGGATWGAAATIQVEFVIAYDVWFDQWTPGDSGTKIHICWVTLTASDVMYCTLDTATDTVSTPVVVFAGASAVSGRGTFVTVAKTKSAYLYCAFDIDAGAEKGLYRSTDGGANWSLLDEPFVEATLDQCIAYPASNTGDDNDCLFLFHDASADALTLKHWDSSGAVASESATIAAVIEGTGDTTGQMPFSGSLRHSDGKIITSALTERDAATADHRVFAVDCTGPGSFTITELTAIATDIDDHYHPAVCIHQATDDIYVAYNGKRDGSETLGTTSTVCYTKSTDDGTSWSAGDTAYMEGAAGAVAQVFAPLMGPRFYVGWRVVSAFSGNAVNSLSLGGAAPTPISEDNYSFPMHVTAQKRIVTVFA